MVESMEDSLKDKLALLGSRLKAGDVAAASEVVDLYYRQIYLYMRRLGHSHSISEELTQECFLDIWSNASRLRNGDALSAWIYNIASNVSKQYWRKRKGHGTVNIDELDLPAGAAAGMAEKNEDLEAPQRCGETIGTEIEGNDCFALFAEPQYSRRRRCCRCKAGDI